MIEHIVLFRVRAGSAPEKTESMLAALRSLEREIPGILSLSCGANTSDRGQGYTHGLVVRFESEEALRAYLPHPRHQQVVQERVLPIVESLIICDYPVDSPRASD